MGGIYKVQSTPLRHSAVTGDVLSAVWLQMPLNQAQLLGFPIQYAVGQD